MLLNKGLTKSLQDQIYEQIRTLILTGQLKSGMNLPPTRKLAERLGVSRNTVSIAYERLRAEGFITTRGTAGTFVAATLTDEWRSAPVKSQDSNIPAEPFLLFGGSPTTNGDGDVLDFWIGRTDPETFPVKIWKRLINRCLTASNPQLTDYCDPAGLPHLRNAIANYLQHARGMIVSANQVLITTGEQEAVDLLFRLLGPNAGKLCIEDPCYRGAAMIFRADGRPVHPIPVDDNGIRIDALPDSRRNLLYVSPAHQFPTGALLTAERRFALLKWAEETDSQIIEDDYDGDFTYETSPIAPLATLDRNQRVFYVNGFSQSIGASVRVGYAVLPQTYSDSAREMKGQMTLGQSWLEQEVLALFISEGYFDKHLQRLRVHYKGRRDCLIDALRENFGNPRLSGTESGLHLVWNLPQDAPDAVAIELRARDVGVGVYALSQAASYSFGSSAPQNALVLGYSALHERQIRTAIRRLKTLFTNWPRT
jgi:GntR family transcriptional regulator/MocR family aminotransferase